MEQRENKVITTLSLLAMIKKGISANKTSSSLSWKVMKNEKNKDTNKGYCIIIPFTNFQSWNYQACVADSAEIWPHCPPLEQLGPDV